MISLWGFHPVQEISAKKKKEDPFNVTFNLFWDFHNSQKPSGKKGVRALSFNSPFSSSSWCRLANTFTIAFNTQQSTIIKRPSDVWCWSAPDVECTLHLWEKAHRALGLSKKVIIHFLRLDVNDELCFFLNHWISCIWAQGHHAMQYGICNYNRCLFQESEGLPCQALHFHLTSHETWMDMDMDRIMDSIPIL